MNTTLQPGQQMQSAHLDADQLSAFAEGALPAHERESALAHLAECSACREVAFLAQPPEPLPNVRPVATPSGWRSWFAGSPLLGAAAAGLVCTLLLAGVIHFRYLLAPEAAPAPAAPAQVAEQSAPPESLPPAPTSVPAPAAKATPSPSPAPALKAPAPVAPTRSDTVAPAPPRMVGAIGAAAPLVPASQSPAIVTRALPAPKPQPGISDSVTAGMYAAPPPLQQQSVAASAGRADMARSAVAAPLPAGTNTGASNAASDTANNSTQFANTMNIETINALPLDEQQLEGRARRFQQAKALPSKLPVASQAVSGGRTLAVDAQGSVFLSTDGGQHWRAVRAQWSGKAAQVTSAPATRQFAAKLPPPPTAAATPTGQNQDIATIGAAVSQTAPSTSQLQPNVFQITTTTLEIWVSIDGITWRRGP